MYPLLIVFFHPSKSEAVRGSLVSWVYWGTKWHYKDGSTSGEAWISKVIIH